MACERATKMEIQRKYDLHEKFEKMDKKLARNLRFLNWQQKKDCQKNYKQPTHLKNCNNFQIMQDIDSSMFQINKTRPEMKKYQVSNHLQEVPECMNKKLEKTDDVSLFDKIKKLQKNFKNGIIDKFNNQCLKYFDKMCDETLHAQFYDHSHYNKMKIIKKDYKNMGLKLEKEFSTKKFKNNVKISKKDLDPKENRIEYEIEKHETGLVKDVKLFQRLLPGRAYQTMIILAKIRYKPYLQSEKSSVTPAAADSAPINLENNGNEDNLLEFSTRRYVSRFFDILSKESVRKYEASKNAATAKLENATRIMKEAYEGNKRQLEQRRREEQDEILKQVLKIHQDLSELFSEEFIIEAIEQCAKEEGLQLMNEITSKKPFSKNKFYNHDCKDIEKELVCNYIIPEACKIIHREYTN